MRLLEILLQIKIVSCQVGCNKKINKNSRFFNLCLKLNKISIATDGNNGIAQDKVKIISRKKLHWHHFKHAYFLMFADLID